MAETKILYNSTQTLLDLPRVAPNGVQLMTQPTTATVRIGTPAVAMPADGDEADVDELSTDVSADANEGETQLAVTEAEFTRGQSLLIQTPTGETFVVTSLTQGESDTLNIDEPLPMAVPTGSTVKGWAVSIPLTLAQTALPGQECLALWTAVVGEVPDEVTYTWAQSFRIVRRQPVWTLTAGSLTKSYPAILNLRSRKDASLSEVIAAALDDLVLPWLEASGIDEEDIITPATLEPVHKIACLLQLTRLNTQITPEMREDIANAWAKAKETALARKSWCVQPQVETPTPRPEQPSKPAMGLRLTR